MKFTDLKIDIPAVFIALRHKNTPFLAKILSGITIAYALSPIDLIPDWIPVLGYIDDVILLPVLIAFTVRLIPANVMDECRESAKDIWKDGRPKKWYFAIPIIIIWLMMILLIILHL